MIDYQYIVRTYYRPSADSPVDYQYFGPFPTEDAANEWADDNCHDWDTLTVEEVLK